MNSVSDYKHISTINYQANTLLNDNVDNLSQNEKVWFLNAVENIKNPQRRIKNISKFECFDNLHKTRLLYAFENDRIVYLLNHLKQYVNQNIVSKSSRDYFLEDVAAIIEAHESIVEHLLKNSDEQFIIDATKRLVIRNFDAFHYMLLNRKNFKSFFQSPERQKVLIELAKLGAQQHGEEISEHIHNYGIDTSTPEGRQGMIEIAKVSAKSCAFKTSQFIKNYGIDKDPNGQEALIEIAKLAAQINGCMVFIYIGEYGIDISTLKGQQGLIEIAKLSAQQNGRETSYYIDRYSINKFQGGQAALIEIAKLAAQQDGFGTSVYIGKYGIDNSTQEGQQSLIEIAMLAVQQDAMSSINIRNYGIDSTIPEGQRGLIEIAKLTAQQRGGSTSMYINDYGIDRSTPEGQQAMIEIAKLAAQNNGSQTSTYISNYGIDPSTPEGQKALREVLNVAIKNCASGTAPYLKNYGVDTWMPQDRERVLYLLYHCFAKQLDFFRLIDLIIAWGRLKTNLEGCSFLPYSLHLEDFEGIFKKHKLEDFKGALTDVLTMCKDKFGMLDDQLHWVHEAWLRSVNMDTHKINLEIFFVVVCLCSKTPELRALFKTQQTTLKKIFKLNSLLKNKMLKNFLNLVCLGNVQAFESLKQAAKNTAHTELACLVLANFPPEGDAGYRAAIKIMQAKREFKDRKKQTLLLETLLKLQKSSLSPIQKADIIKRLSALPAENFLAAVKIIADLLAFKCQDDLSHFSCLADLQNALWSLFNKKFNMNLDNFYEKFEKTIALWRQKEAVMTYAGKLCNLPNTNRELACKLFQELLTLILNGSFQQDRYSTHKNPHLAEIQSLHETVFTQWQHMTALTSSEMLLEKKDEDIPVSKHVIQTLQRALEQHHLGGDKSRDIYPHVAFCSGKWDKLGESLEHIISEMIPLEGRKLSAEEFEKQKVLLLQKQLVELLKNPENLEKKLIELKSLVSKEAEFYRDIESALKMLKTSLQETTTSYQVIDTDDPNHFMLMGTEVLNSCQDVHGKPELNVCLLGYFLDGKHRLGLVCDNQGKIVARAVFRLLIDELNQPVLFQERMYVANANPVYGPLLRKLAIKKAANLGIPLVVSSKDYPNEAAATIYPYPIYAKQKPVPFEYVDALNGKQEREYVIHNPLLICSS